MRLIISALTILLALSGCESNQERMTKTMEKQIRSTIEVNWHGGIPLGGLVDANKMCQEHHRLRGCDTVQEQLQDIAITLSSCRADQRSTLCKTVVDIIGKHSITTLLPQADAVQLPNTPFYWKLPTFVLEAQTDNFEYREEVASWWLKTWRTTILSCFALFVGVITAWFGWSTWRKAKQKRTALLARQRAERVEEERIRRIQTEQARAEAEHQAKLERETAIAEQKRLAAKKTAERQAAEAAAKLAAEQAEAALLLKAAFAPAKPKRRKNAPSSK